jgi:8-oxo-dGTP pyrophosphatase MutT (NUDIX family)
MPDPIRAAGGVLYRPAGDGVEVCLVHRPRYDDWTLPKGKLDDGEEPLAAAVREVREETGVAGRPELRLPAMHYDLPDGTPKTVDFWLMRTVGDGPVQDVDEVDEVAWLSPAAATARARYAQDKALLTEVAGLPPVTAVTPVVRHAHAGDRKHWKGEDALRPLSDKGRAQAERLGLLLAFFAPRRLYSATPLRCKQTLEPLAARVDVPIVIDGAFAEPPLADDAPAKAKLGAQRLIELRDADGAAVMSSQGKVLPFLLAALAGVDDPARFHTPKGEGWLLTWSGDRLLDVSRL